MEKPKEFWTNELAFNQAYDSTKEYYDCEWDFYCFDEYKDPLLTNVLHDVHKEDKDMCLRFIEYSAYEKLVKEYRELRDLTKQYIDSGAVLDAETLNDKIDNTI